MAFVGVSQYNHNQQQIDEYDYDDTENFYDDGGNYGNYLEVDDSEGKYRSIHLMHKHILLYLSSDFVFLDTEEASESEWTGHAGRTQNEPLEIKEL